MKKKKKMLETMLGMIILLVLLGGCAHTTQSEEQTNTDYGSNATDTQVIGLQDETDADKGQTQNKAVFMDEKLDENLLISAELKMPENSLYEYSTGLKNFDYDKAQEAIQDNAEGTIGGEAGSLIYQRNDMAGHLDTYCAYAGEQGLVNDKELSFRSKEDAVAQIQSLMEQFEVGGKFGTPDVIAMDKADFVNVQKVIMEDDSYRKTLSAKGYESDTFDEDLEVYRMTFRMEVDGISVYRNEPWLRQTTERYIAYPVTVMVLLSNSGIEMMTMIGMLEPYDGSQKEVDVIGEDGIKEAIIKKFDDVILPVEYKAVNIWMEYFPLLKEDSFTDVDLIPVWCVDFEINGETVGDSQYTIRFHAVTGEEIS